MAKVLMLSPHCDDIPLSLGAGLLAGEWGDDVRVLVIFSVSRYTLRNGWDNDPQAATALRNDEERRVAAAAGYAVEFLGLPEPGVRPGYSEIGDIFNPGRPFEPDPVWPELRGRLLAILAGQTGTVVSPLGVGRHIDHRMVAACVGRPRTSRPLGRPPSTRTCRTRPASPAATSGPWCRRPFRAPRWRPSCCAVAGCPTK